MVVVFAVTDPGTGDIVYVGASSNPAGRMMRLRWEKVRHSGMSEWLRSLPEPPETVVLDETETLAQAKACAVEWRRKLGVDGRRHCRRLGWPSGKPRRPTGRT